MNKLTSGNLAKNIFLFSIPLIISNVLQVLFNMADISVIGKFGEANSLGSVGSSSSLITLFTGFIIGISGGGNVLIARYIGEKREDMVKKSLKSAFLIQLVFGFLAALLGILLAGVLLNIINTNDLYYSKAKIYIQIYLLGLPFLSIFNFANAAFSASGDTLKPMLILLGAGIVNIALNLLFVIELNLDVIGVALASFISQFLAAFTSVLLLHLEKSIIKFNLIKNKSSKDILIEMLKIGMPTGLQNSMFGISNSLIQGGVNSLGPLVIDGNSAAINSDPLVYDALAAFYLAGSSFVSQNFGAKNKKRIIKSYHLTLIYSFALASILGALLIIFNDEFLFLFTNSREVVESGKVRLFIMALSYPFSVFMDVSMACSRGLGKSFVPMLILMLGVIVFRIVWIYTIFALFKTIVSLYLLYIFSWFISGILQVIYFRYLVKKLEFE